MSFDSYTNSGQGQNLFQQLPIQSTRDPVNGVDFNDPGGGPYQIGRTWFNKTSENYWHYVGQGIWILDAGGTGPLIKVGVPAGTSPILPDATGLINFTSTGGTVTITGTAGGLGNQDINFDVTGGAVMEKFNIDTSTPPGTNPVVPTAGLVTIEGGATYATGTRPKPIRTNSLAASTIDLEIQLAGSNAASSTPNNFGVSQFDSNQFAVTSGFVQLKGGGVNPALTKLAVQTGTTPVVPNSTGQITFNGAVVAGGTNPVRTDGTGANTVALEVQQASTVSPTPGNNNAIGLASYNANQFTIDSTSGMVSLKGNTTNGPILTITGDTGGAEVPDSSGNFNIKGTTNQIIVTGSANTETLSLYSSANKSSFFAYVATDLNNVTGDGTNYNVIFNTEIFDTGSNFNTSTGVFTAPIAGIYQFNSSISCKSLAAGNTTGKIIFLYNGSTQLSGFRGNYGSLPDAGGVFQVCINMIYKMAVNDTMQILYVVNGGGKTVGIYGLNPGAISNFSGSLLA